MNQDEKLRIIKDRYMNFLNYNAILKKDSSRLSTVGKASAFNVGEEAIVAPSFPVDSKVYRVQKHEYCMIERNEYQRHESCHFFETMTSSGNQCVFLNATWSYSH